MRNAFKLLFLLFAFNIVLTSCTVEEDILIDDTLETVSTDPHKKDLEPPIDPND